MQIGEAHGGRIRWLHVADRYPTPQGGQHALLIAASRPELPEDQDREPPRFLPQGSCRSENTSLSLAVRREPRCSEAPRAFHLPGEHPSVRRRGPQELQYQRAAPQTSSRKCAWARHSALWHRRCGPRTFGKRGWMSRCIAVCRNDHVRGRCSRDVSVDARRGPRNAIVRRRHLEPMSCSDPSEARAC